MGVIANLLGWTLRAIAYFVGREKVIRYLMNLAEKNGSPQIADAIRSKYFEMYGEVLRPLPTDGAGGFHSGTPEAK